ncbi:hypothetical protein CCACVL1_07707 [Corchorus capsularis]|uniref:Expansin-like CBD domain-containing protein n=1 Tax=Corchorus capsularis TaxID=210143 RepID=A0A1R3J4B9_COCAP|nr:hypothetical protein CCACVL1_07707 [Corchorus capsularis]
MASSFNSWRFRFLIWMAFATLAIIRGGGDIAKMWVKGSKTGWISMSHNWGASYQAFATLGGQSLSFKLTSYTSKETIIAYNVAPANWNVGMAYKSNVNFH